MEGNDSGVRDEPDPAAAERNARLVESLLAGEHRALARIITRIENRAPGYRDLVSRLHGHAGDAVTVGVTGSPGAGKSTLVDKLAKAYRDRGDTVGVVAVDPASPYSGGSVLGDRIRMASTVGDMDVFFRSMSARGQLGGLSTATTDAITALSAFGKDVIVVETVGAGQSEVDIVRTTDTVAVVVQPGSGDDVQMLKAGILEIGDVFVVNKADRDGAEQTVREVEEMLRRRDSPSGATPHAGHHGSASSTPADDAAASAADWEPAVVETVATTGEGIDGLVASLDAHAEFLRRSGRREEKAIARYADEIRRLVRNDVNAMLETELDRRGGARALARRVYDRETDPYAVASAVVDPICDCVDATRDGSRTQDRDADCTEAEGGEPRS
ncbi:MAG: methylmalonyl Co-A mutase-associated GTPase MeaB [Haloquadratum sp.]